jgi:signal transduction histidine kinase
MELDARTLSVQGLAVTSLSDQRVGTVILVRDVTEDVQRERAQAALLEQMVETVEKPLNTEAAFARDIKRHTVTLQKLIVEMRDMIADAPLVQSTNRTLPLETLIWAVANEWRQVAQAANLSLNVSVESPGLQVYGDERRLRWAIGNLVDNAIKYTTPGGKVSIEIKGEEQGFARLRIRDNGVGIAVEELPNVFTRFYRGNPVSPNGRTLRVPGTGQGLTIAQQIIEAHGGQISLRSSQGVGTAVYFTLPMTENPVSLERIVDDGEEEETIQLEDRRGGAD